MRKAVIISGASRGIGAELAKTFAKNGYNILINYNKTRDKALALCNYIISQYGVNADVFQADVSCFEQVEKMVKYAISIFGSIDVVVCNAAISLIKPVLDTTISEFKAVMDINFGGSFNLSKAVLEHMITNDKGNIIFISSMWAETGASCESVYSASKGAIESYAKSLRQELEFTKINVDFFAPGFVDTEMNAHLSVEEREEAIKNCPLKRAQSALEVAENVLNLIK